MIVANVQDFREAARRRLPHFLFEYIDGGSFAQVTLRRNIQDLELVALRANGFCAMFRSSNFRPNCSVKSWRCRSRSRRSAWRA